MGKRPARFNTRHVIFTAIVTSTFMTSLVAMAQAAPVTSFNAAVSSIHMETMSCLFISTVLCYAASPTNVNPAVANADGFDMHVQANVPVMSGSTVIGSIGRSNDGVYASSAPGAGMSLDAEDMQSLSLFGDAITIEATQSYLQCIGKVSESMPGPVCQAGASLSGLRINGVTQRAQASNEMAGMTIRLDSVPIVIEGHPLYLTGVLVLGELTYGPNKRSVTFRAFHLKGEACELQAIFCAMNSVKIDGGPAAVIEVTSGADVFAAPTGVSVLVLEEGTPPPRLTDTPVLAKAFVGANHAFPVYSTSPP